MLPTVGAAANGADNHKDWQSLCLLLCPLLVGIPWWLLSSWLVTFREKTAGFPGEAVLEIPDFTLPLLMIHCEEGTKEHILLLLGYFKDSL